MVWVDDDVIDVAQLGLRCRICIGSLIERVASRIFNVRASVVVPTCSSEEIDSGICCFPFDCSVEVMVCGWLPLDMCDRLQLVW